MRQQAQQTEGRKRDVLLAIWNLRKEGEPQSYARISANTGLIRSDYYVRLLANDGLVTKSREGYGSIEFTKTGEKLVQQLLTQRVSRRRAF